MTDAELKHYFGVMVEHVTSQVQMLAEGHALLRQELLSVFNDRCDRIEMRVGALEVAVVRHSKEIQELRIEIQGVREELKAEFKSEIQGVREELQLVEQRLTAEIRHIHTRLDAHDQILAGLQGIG
ncbi:MAG: hypothetical protein HY696_06940 [Deltaproteobacteria bacterium]|nr:hypothetical protein [Deltaproteobacteria bacterium]